MPDEIVEKDIVLGVMHNDEFAANLAERGLKGLRFENKMFHWITKEVIQHWRKPEYGHRRPSKKVLVQLVKDDGKINDDDKSAYIEAIKTLSKAEPDSPRFHLDRLEKFVRGQDFMKRMETVADMLEQKQDVDSAINYMANSLFTMQMKKQEEEGITISPWLSEFGKRQEKRKDRKAKPELYKRMRYGVRKLDKLVPRGQGPAETGAIAGKTGVGKSIFLINVGFTAACDGLNVVHLITENEEDQILSRYDSRATAVPYDVLQTYDYTGKNRVLLPQAHRMMEMLLDTIGDRIRVVKCVPKKTNILTVHNILEGLEMRENFKCDVLLGDSTDLMIPVGHYSEYRLSQAAVLWEWKAFVIERMLMSFVATFLKASADDDDPKPEDVAEAYDKAKILDWLYFLILNKLLEVKGELKIHLAKCRDSGNMGSSLITQPDYSRMLVDTI